MQLTIALTLTLALFSESVAGRASTGTETHLIVQVIDMLEAKKSTVKQEGLDEEYSYTKFTKWCGESAVKLDKAIADGRDLIATRLDEEEALKQKIASLDEEIEKINAEIADRVARKTKADTVRADTNADYVEVQNHISGVIAAITTAYETVELAANTTDAGFRTPAFLQKVHTGLHTVKSVLGGYMNEDQLHQVDTAMKAQADPAVYGERVTYEKQYTSKMGRVLELLAKLKAKFESDKYDSTVQETNSLNSYTLAMQANDAEKLEQERILGVRTTTRAEKQGDFTSAETERKSTQEDLGADKNSLADLRKDCAIKDMQWKKRSETRTAELEAISSAIEILSKVTGVRTEMNKEIDLPPAVTPLAPETTAAPVFLQIAPTTTAAPVFLQIDSEQDKKSPHVPRKVLESVASMLRTKSSTFHSKALSWLARQLERTPRNKYFGNVIDMILKMIWRLEDEQKKDTDHKFWCDQELSKTLIIYEQKIDKETELTDLLAAKRAELNVEASKIQISEEKIVELVEMAKKAKEIRYINRKENLKSIEDAKDAQKALSNAISLLEDYFKDSGAITKEPWEEFIQQPVVLPANPATWTASYTGASTGPEGIIQTLTSTAAHFSQMQEDTEVQEEMDQQQFDLLMKDTEVEKARRETDIRMKTEKKGRVAEKIQDVAVTLKHAATEVRAAKRYAFDLAEACEQPKYFDNATTGESITNMSTAYNNRLASRTEEIEALKQAQHIIYTATVNISTVTAGPIAGPTMPPIPEVNATNSSNASTVVFTAEKHVKPHQSRQHKKKHQQMLQMTGDYVSKEHASGWTIPIEPVVSMSL